MNAKITRYTASFRWTKNGAWIGNSGSETVREIPQAELNTPNGADWLRPGRCDSIMVELSNGAWLHLDGADDPIRVTGFGPLGHIGETLIHYPNPELPNVAATYYGVKYFTDEELSAFVPLK